MKNKWLVLLVVLMVFINNGAFAQEEKEDIAEEAWTERTDAFSISCRTCWLYDPLDSVGSIKQEKIEHKKIKENFFIKTNNKTIDSLLQIATSKNKDVNTRAHAINQLATINSIRQIPTIEKMILTENCDSCYGIRGGCLDVLMNLDTIDSKQDLIEALNKHWDINDKLNIALLLAFNGEKTNSFKVLYSIWNSDIKYKTRCHVGFRDINTPESINMLQTAIKNEDPIVVLDAAACMAELNYKDESFASIKELLHNIDSRVRMSTIRVLAYYIGDDKSFDLIKQMLNDSDSEVREYCQAILNKYKIK